MYSLDNPSGVAVMPPVSATQSTETRWFTDGGINQATSYPGAEWFNIVQAELLNVLSDSGIKPEKGKLNQLSEAIRIIIGKQLPMATNTKAGVVKLNSAINSSSVTEAATPSAVKQVYDLAASKANKSDIPKTASDIKAIPETQLGNLAAVSGRTKIDDIDTINLSTGIYSYGNGAINSPNSSAGHLIQLYPYRNEWLYQLWAEAYTSNLYLRSKKSERENIFNPWVKLLTELDLQKQISDSYGWLKLGNLIIQWGINTTTSALGEWSFPISYPSRCCIVLVNACQPGYSSAAESASWNSQVTTNSKFGVVSYQGFGGASVGNVSWFSIGY